MNINSYESEDLSGLIDNYHLHTADSFDNLTSKLKNADKRIKFEEWLIKDFSPDKAKVEDFEWHSRVITLLVTNCFESQSENKTMEQEDLLIAGLITKALPLEKNLSISHKRSYQKSDFSNKTLNIQQISKELKSPKLPFTSTVIIRRLHDYKDLIPILKQAISDNNVDLVKIIIKQKPKDFKAALDLKDGGGATFVLLAVKENRLEIANLMIQHAPREFNSALTVQEDKKGVTPVHIAAAFNKIEIMQIMAEGAHEGFFKALTLQDKKGLTPVSYAFRHIKMLKYMNQTAPEAFKIAMSIRDFTGCSVLDRIKSFRPGNYREITHLYKNNINLRNLNKEIVNRKALSHAWHLSGTSKLIATDTNIPLANIPLTGWNSPQWFHMLRNDLEAFTKNYPEMLSGNEMKFKKILHMGANSDSYSLEHKLGRIKGGMATILNTGYPDHGVTLLIWGEWFVICNRGGASKRPIDFYHFDNKNLDLDDLRKISEVRNQTAKDYKKLFYEELNEKLNLSVTALDLQLNKKSSILPKQTIGNCSFVSPITSVCALSLLAAVHGIDKEGRLLGGMQNRSFVIEKALAWYQIWLSFEQTTILERIIRPLENKAHYFKPDHAIIVESLRKAHLLPLDDLCQQKLAALTEIYLNFLGEKGQSQLKSDLIYWKTLAKTPLL